MAAAQIAPPILFVPQHLLDKQWRGLAKEKAPRGSTDGPWWMAILIKRGLSAPCHGHCACCLRRSAAFLQPTFLSSDLFSEYSHSPSAESSDPRRAGFVSPARRVARPRPSQSFDILEQSKKPHAQPDGRTKGTHTCPETETKRSLKGRRGGQKNVFGQHEGLFTMPCPDTRGRKRPTVRIRFLPCSSMTSQFSASEVTTLHQRFG